MKKPRPPLTPPLQPAPPAPPAPDATTPETGAPHAADATPPEADAPPAADPSHAADATPPEGDVPPPTQQEIVGELEAFANDWLSDIPAEAAHGQYAATVRDRWHEKTYRVPDGAYDPHESGWIFRFENGRFIQAELFA